MSELLRVSNLRVAVEEKEILKGIDLTIGKGEVHVVMGPNGAGKSTLANAIMAHPKYTVVEGDICLEGESILEASVDERARKGIFMSFQAPRSVPGVTVEDFLRAARQNATGKNVPVLKFKKELKQLMSELDMSDSYSERYLNVGFSGGEKKKGEILQMKVLDPKLVLLDETDSGLDVDAVRVVSNEVANFLNEEKSCLIITHHNEILSAIHPQFVHVRMNGKLVKHGGPELIERIHKEGYEWIREELGLQEEADYAS